MIASPSGNNVTNRIELGRSITAGTSLRFYLNAGGYNNGKVTVFNGATEVGSVTAESSQASGFYSLDVGSFPLTFTAVQVSRSSNGYGSGMSQIEVDSSILKDPLARFGDAVATNFNPFNTDINTVRGQESGYATLNPLQQSLNSTPTISNGNLTLTKSAGSAEWTNTGCTMNIPKSGKWFWEITWTSVGGGSVARCGVADSDDYEFNRNTSGTGLPWMGSGTGTSWSCDVRGYVYNGGTETTGYLSAFAAGDVMGILLDRDNNTITYTRNGVSGGVAHSNVTPDFVTPGFGLHAGTTNSLDVNFGQKPFKFPPPDGFQPLNAANVRSETVIARPDQYVGIATWTGDGNNRFIEYGMQPDLFVVKARNDSYRNGWFDSIRGFKNVIWSDRTLVQQNNSTYPEDPTPTGITVNNDDGQTNQNTKTYVGWAWKAGGNKNTFNVDGEGYASAAAAGLDGGTATVTGASVGTKQGFSIIKYTTTTNAGNFTVSHGLSEAPKFIITRKIASGNWVTGHDDLGWTKYLFLNTTAGPAGTNANAWGNISPTSSVFGGNDSNFYGNGVEQISYIWHDVPGLQKFGVYEGNGNDNGPYVELGFRPSILWVKNIDASGDWVIHDNQRNKFNPAGKVLKPNTTGTEDSSTSNYVDFLSNGFKIRNSQSKWNGGYTYIYCAWAEAPASNLFGVQSNAR